MIVDPATTIVIDAGARYGMHPSWQAFGAPLRYFAFEPDAEEARRLEGQRRDGFEVVRHALGRCAGERELRLTRHRGCSSFLEVDQDSEWFGRYRPGEGQLEGTRRVWMQAVDDFAEARGLLVDFLKVDTEGTELEVLEGAERQLGGPVMGVRVNVNFQPAYKGQALFPDIHGYLVAKGFFLLNLDYFGRGVPCYGLVRNPDPLMPDTERYGVLVASDGVWLKRYRQVRDLCRGDGAAEAYGTLKYAYFCLLNHAPDVAMETLMGFVAGRRDAFGPEVVSSRLYRALRKACATFLGRWRVYPDAQWELARSTFQQVFGLELEAGSKYWELIQNL